MFSVYVKPGETMATYGKQYGSVSARSESSLCFLRDEFRAEIKKLLDRSFVMNNAVNVLTLIIAGFGIIVTLLASVMERTREIGLLRAIGMKRSQVSGLVITESLLLGAAGGLLGSATGVMVGWINLEGFFRIDFGASIAYQIHYGSVAWAMLLSAGFPYWPDSTLQRGRQKRISSRRCRTNRLEFKTCLSPWFTTDCCIKFRFYVRAIMVASVQCPSI